MKSRITIDLDNDNQPVVKIDYQPSDDVRDKMVKRFLETFGHSSVWCRWEYYGQVGEGSTSILTPISPSKLEENQREMRGLIPTNIQILQGGSGIVTFSQTDNIKLSSQ